MHDSRARYADDIGAADPELARALSAYAEDPTPERTAAVLNALVGARLLVPVVAELLEADTDPVTGLAVDKSADVAQPLLVTTSGAHATVAFTSVAAMASWRADARPVPAGVQTVAGEAVARDHAGLVLDPAGPVPFHVDRAALELLAAAGEDEPLTMAAPAEIAPADEMALRTALAAESLLAEAWLVDVGDAKGSAHRPALALLLRSRGDAATVVARRILGRLAGRTAATYDVLALSPADAEQARQVGVRLWP